MHPFRMDCKGKLEAGGEGETGDGEKFNAEAGRRRGEAGKF